MDQTNRIHYDSYSQEYLVNQIIPSINYVKAQKLGTEFTVRIVNINKNVGKLQIEKFIRWLLNTSECSDVPQAKIEGEFERKTNSIIKINMVKGQPISQAWIQTSHRPSVIEILKHH